ncbi:hypothetical protein F2Q69_00043739 [Brassica cretica]|uniref:Uncharacterized protein n=1 Tax=Brassica cretica TaxID=69181 RepID=A0A8S9NRX3_BRACR|nr:hypothetical protein F2Q69_00043739 [Brassica cretica]
MRVESRLLAVSSRVKLLFVGRLVSSGGFFYHGGDGERCRLWLLDSCSRCFLISNLHCSALVFALCVMVSAFSMEYRLVVYVLFVSVWHWRWTLTAKSVALRSAEDQLFLCIGAAFPLFAGFKASGRGFGGAYNPSSAWIALLPKSIL